MGPVPPPQHSQRRHPPDLQVRRYRHHQALRVHLKEPWTPPPPRAPLPRPSTERENRSWRQALDTGGLSVSRPSRPTPSETPPTQRPSPTRVPRSSPNESQLNDDHHH